MALDVYLQENKNPPKTFNGCFLQFENDGYCWYLYDLFESLGEESGRIIDLSDDAFFKGETLDLLNKTVHQAKERIIQKPEVWEEFIGTTVEKGVKTKVVKIYSTVYKKELEPILAKLEKAIGEAKEKRIGILFFGD